VLEKDFTRMATIRVGMAQFAVAKNPSFLETQSLGSCVGVALYEPQHKIGGMAHPMLSDIRFAKESSRTNLGKFVNTAIEELIKEMIRQGARKEYIEAKLAGGANMFPDIPKQDVMHIGRRNVEAAKEKLEELGIPIIAEETGGSVGRTISLDTTTGKLRVRTAMLGEREI
jgi:chemotaxis protein CheD